MSSLTTSIENLYKTESEYYSAKASIVDGMLDVASTTVTGDRNSPLFQPTNELGKQDFLKLLVAQLQFQDPLNPMENTEFIAQLAQFSSLEGNNNIETAINNLDDSFDEVVDAQSYSAQSMTNASAVSLIGKDIRLLMDAFSYMGTAGEEAELRIHLGNAESAVVNIVDSSGETVRKIVTEGKDGENSTTIFWDGLRDDGKRADPGKYQIVIEGQDTNTALYAFVQDMVEGVRFSAEGPLVKVNGKEMSIANILDVSIGSADSSFEGLSPTSAISLLGKTVRFENSAVHYRSGENAVFNVNLGNVTNTAIEILNTSGEVVKVFYTKVSRDTLTDGNGNVVTVPGDVVISDNGRDVGKVIDGTATVLWDGSTSDGNGFVQTGNYSVRIKGESSNPSLYVFSEGTVDGISNLNGVPYIRVNGYAIPLSAIIDISSDNAQEDAV